MGVYLADKPNNVDAIVTSFACSQCYEVIQRWGALRRCPTPAAPPFATMQVTGPAGKFEVIGSLLASIDISRYEYLIVCDDDIAMPERFLDRYLPLQTLLALRLAQPARTPDSFIDHPIVEQSPGVLARQTLFVESGPLFSIHRSIYDLMLPFDLTSPMGWGYENVWSARLSAHGHKMGIIDAFPVQHQMRRPASYYNWREADQGRVRLLDAQPHRVLHECTRILEVISDGN